jgi:hypothetical protein
MRRHSRNVGSGDERAQEFLDQMVEEVTGNDENQDVESAELAETGDAATTISYRVAKPVEGEDAEEGAEQEYRQQRVVARTGNVVVTVDYQGTGFEGDDLPAADDVRAAAETAAREAVAAVDASAEEGAATPEAGAESGGESGASGEESGAAAGDDVENDARSE